MKISYLDKIYEGKAKILYKTKNENQLVAYFKDDATAFNNTKKDVIESKGILNNFISEYLMTKLANNGIATHFIKRLSRREQLVKKVKIFPIEIIIRNVSAGSMAKRLGIDEGIELDGEIFEICYKNDEVGDPIINEDHAIKVLKLINKDQLAQIRETSLRINEILKDIFLEINIKLIDFKLEFGIDSDDIIILADEVSPDSCRLWDLSNNNEKMDKDRFRRDLGGLIEAYSQIAKRLKIQID